MQTFEIVFSNGVFEIVKAGGMGPSEQTIAYGSFSDLENLCHNLNELLKEYETGRQF